MNPQPSTREELLQAVRANLGSREIEAEDVRVQPDPYGGWRIAVVAGAFTGQSLAERRAVVLAGLDDLDVEWIDLLTPEEREWAGDLPGDTEPEQLPLWPEALARGGAESAPARFPSDLDDDLPPPIVTTFYSLRGGVGRSTALAYTGRILAANGRKVVCVDMDLEAPGLAALFGQESEVGAEQGVVSLLLQLDQGETPDFASHLIRLDESDDLYLVPAGLPDADYARRLRFIEPSVWYREEHNPLRLLLDGLRDKLPFRPDVILLDARTGITPLSGPLLFDLADIAVVVLFPHPQTRRGTEMLVSGLLAAQTHHRSVNGHALAPEPRFLVSPIPASKAPEVIQRYEHRSLAWIAEWLSPANRERQGKEILESEVTHFVRYREDVATSDRILRDTETWRAFQGVADWVERFLPTRGEARAEPSLEKRKIAVLEELRFASGTAEDQENFLDYFVETQVVRDAIRPDVPLVLGRKGSGKTAVFRRLSENVAQEAIVVHSPTPLKGDRPWLMSADGFQGVEELLGGSGIPSRSPKGDNAGWRHFWSFYTSIAVTHGLGASGSLPEKLGGQDLPTTQGEVLDVFEQILGKTRFGIRLNDWLSDLDRRAAPDTLLLLDGLDAGFGSDQTDRDRRRRAVQDLFTFWTDQGSGLQNLRLKILLREDIWKALRFENKSHLFGRSVSLKWQDQATFFKVVLKQALRSNAFRDLLVSVPGGERLASVTADDWSGEDVFAAWGLLVGERMKGGKTTFTRNWVWNRLGDANGDHAPRHLLQLFYAAGPWEKKEHARNPYNRTVIRPRGLIESLPAVSGMARDSLAEEFSELEELMSCLSQLGRTPVAAHDLKDHESAVELAREVGLLNVYEGTDDRVERYKVPDIYRYGLNMTRMGQA